MTFLTHVSGSNKRAGASEYSTTVFKKFVAPICSCSRVHLLRHISVDAFGEGFVCLFWREKQEDSWARQVVS